MYQFPLMRLLTVSRLSFLLLMLAAGVRAYAQSSMYLENDRTFYAGLIAGANFTQIDGDDFAGYDKQGLNVGGIVYTKLDEHLAVSLEILYAQKGSKSKYAQELDPGFFITTYGASLNYAEIPVLVNYFDKRKHHFGGGFSYSRLATVKEYITTNPPQAYNLEQYPFKKSDINLILNGDVHLYKGLFLNIRFQYSILPVREKIPQSYTKAPQFNNVWAIRLMYLFI